MIVDLKPIAESKVRQLGGDVCGVLVRTDGGVMAVSEHGRCTRLDVGVMGPFEPGAPDIETERKRFMASFEGKAELSWLENAQQFASVITQNLWESWQIMAAQFNRQAARAQGGQGAEVVDGKGSLPWFVRVYNSGYEAGHHDTVEGGFTPIHYSDADTYHEEQVLEILEDLGVQASSDTQPQPQPAVPEDDGWIKCSERLPEPRVSGRKAPNGILVKFDTGRITQIHDVTETLVARMKSGPRHPAKFEAPTPPRIVEWMDLDNPKPPKG